MVRVNKPLGQGKMDIHTCISRWKSFGKPGDKLREFDAAYAQRVRKDKCADAANTIARGITRRQSAVSDTSK